MPTLSLPNLRPGSREEWRHLAQRELTVLALSLGDKCAALVAAKATTRYDWEAVASNLRSITDEMRGLDAAAGSKAALELAKGEGVGAAYALAQVEGVTMQEWRERALRDAWSAQATESLAGERSDRTVA